MSGLKLLGRVLDALQSAARGKQPTNKQMADAFGTSDTSIARAVRSLIAGGYVVRPERGVYKLTKLGRTTQPAHVIDSRVLDSRTLAEDHGICEAFWQRLRRLRITTVEESVEALFDAGEIRPSRYQDLNRYCVALESAGYIACHDVTRPKIKRRIKWRLVNDTGIHSPKMSKDRLTVVDRNTKKVHEVTK